MSRARADQGAPSARPGAAAARRTVKPRSVAAATISLTSTDFPRTPGPVQDEQAA